MSAIKITTLISVPLALMLFSLFFGPTLIIPFSGTPVEKEILFSIRLPRVMVAMLMGMALGASGAVLQGILKNPLADPYILGISSGAALTAVLGIVSGVSLLGEISTPLTALAGAVTVSFMVGAFGWKRGGIVPDRLLLAGIGLGFLFYAILMLIITVTTDEAMRKAMLWIFGDLSIADWSSIPYGIFFISAGIFTCVMRAKALNALMLGDELAHSLGFSVQRERLLLFLSVAVMTAASVSLGGTIGFIGLIIPHVVRFFVGPDNRYLIPFSSLCGGAFLCMADLIGRTVMAPVEIPSGIVTAIIGAPYFLYLLRRKDVLSA
jgi:iron complex transport system permease protein